MKADLTDLNMSPAVAKPNEVDRTTTALDVAFGVEKFSAADLIALRQDLLQTSVDSFQAAEIVANFLTGRGYGCSPVEARSVALTIEVPGATAEHIQAALENLARVM